MKQFCPPSAKVDGKVDRAYLRLWRDADEKFPGEGSNGSGNKVEARGLCH